MCKQLLSRLKNNELYKNIFLLLSGNGISQVIPLLIYPIISRLYKPEDFGILAFIFSIHSIILILSTGRFDVSIILPKYNSQANSLFNIGLSIAVVLVGLLPVVFLFFSEFTNVFKEYNDIRIWFYLLSLTILFNAYSLLLNGWCTRKKMFKNVVRYTLVVNLSTSGLKLLFGLIGLKDGLLIAFVLAQIIAGFSFYQSVARLNSHPKIKLFQKTDFIVFREYKNFPLFNTPHALINTISSNLPVLILTFYFSEYITGQFSLAYALLFKPVSVYANSVAQALSQKVVEMKNEGNQLWPMINKYLKRTFIIAIFPAIILAFIAPWIFPFVLGENWIDAGKICRLLIPWPLAVIHGGSLAFIPNVFNKQLKALIVDIIYICLRLIALSIGIIVDNAFIGIGLFSITGFIVIGYLLIWYRTLLRNHDRGLNQAK